MTHKWVKRSPRRSDAAAALPSAPPPEPADASDPDAKEPCRRTERLKSERPHRRRVTVVYLDDMTDGSEDDDDEEETAADELKGGTR